MEGRSDDPQPDPEGPETKDIEAKMEPPRSSVLRGLPELPKDLNIEGPWRKSIDLKVVSRVEQSIHVHRLGIVEGREIQ